MSESIEAVRVVSAEREIAASAERVFALIADPAQQPFWDGNQNLANAAAGQRITGVGESFLMTLTTGAVRENHVVEFEEGRLIAWQPSEPGAARPGHLWRWELRDLGDGRALVTHTYDWTVLTDEKRLVRARATTPEMLRASIDRLATLAEQG
ncbi:SRPBCC family protein [Nocardia sp. NBC_00511]|uniref:SRPBCC family protein n=1 Tax=Nocardia sp. NBC_00511 TaxID=2903591 RepID=UPI0030E5D17F